MALEADGETKICVPSVDDLTATNLSKLSSTSFRMSCERASIEDFRCVIPAASSWYVASECMRAKNVFGWNVLDVMRMAASEQWNSVSNNYPIRHSWGWDSTGLCVQILDAGRSTFSFLAEHVHISIHSM